jgi:hypothetical protein
MSKQGVYGFPCVSDPNDFIPDAECSSPTEIEAHTRACANYGKPAYEPNKGCYSVRDDSGQMVMHVTRTSWGIGTNLVDYCDGCNTPPFDDPLMTCHECGGMEFCPQCWPEHERAHDEGRI